jgi:sortase A
VREAAAPTTTTTPRSTTTTDTTAPAVTTTTITTTTTVPVVLPEIAAGDAVARIEIPRIGVDKIVVSGVSVADLRRGPGHYPGTPLPGQPGNAAIAGHRTTYGAPFYRIDELAAGDDIVVTTLQGRFRYVVDGTAIVRPSQLEVLDATPDPTLTLTSCNPRYSARQRIVVTARLAPEVAAAPVTPVPAERRTPRSESTAASPEPAAAPALADAEIGVSDPDARWPALLTGALTALIALGTWLLGRVWRRWPAYLIGVVPFGLALFVFYGRLSRALPTNF